MNSLNATVKKIKNLKIQGAKAIAVASLFSLTKESKFFSGTSRAYLKQLAAAAALLASARPTEPLTVNCLKFVIRQLEHNATAELKYLQNICQSTVLQLEKIIEEGSAKIITAGQSLFKPGQKVLTHCHSSTVEKILITANNKGALHVFNTETRPLFQGRITAKNLTAAKVHTTMVADSAAPFLISSASGRDLMMDVVILGADAVMPDGSAINKLGSYGIALAAKNENVSLYVACHLLKMDNDGIIPIEIRKSAELWANAPTGLKIINFAFDKIPARYITGYITEFGIVKPSEVKALVTKHYPWIFN